MLRGHCDAVGRDPNEIEVTAMFRNMPPDPSVEDVVRSAEEFAAIGVSSLVISTTGDDPAAWMESTFGPAMDGLAALEPVRL